MARWWVIEARSIDAQALEALERLEIVEHATADLTPREREIALLAAQGLSSRGIADRLVLSVRTVDNHLQSAYRKLGVSGR